MFLKNIRKYKKVEKITHTLTTQIQPLLAFYFISFWSFSIHFSPHACSHPHQNTTAGILSSQFLLFISDNICFLTLKKELIIRYLGVVKTKRNVCNFFASSSEKSVGDNGGNVIMDQAVGDTKALVLTVRCANSIAVM